MCGCVCDKMSISSCPGYYMSAVKEALVQVIACLQQKLPQSGLLYVCSERGLDPGYIPERKDGEALEMRTVFEPHYKMLWQRSFPCPLMALDSAEMMGDGLENLIVLTSHGLHIMQVSSVHESAKDQVIVCVCVCVCLCVC